VLKQVAALSVRPAQRRRLRDAVIATATPPPGSQPRMGRHLHVNKIKSGLSMSDTPSEHQPVAPTFYATTTRKVMSRAVAGVAKHE
jgi:hypothetical protein